ncbi:DUF192 domain-containing protein [Pseudonocardia sp. CA-107938]|uniref:DUF192 domain-containing protein n=1 Tax=Pseudonocardia sp. CA-107938 TaxID=3240021 RepID=UPI003D9252AF
MTAVRAPPQPAERFRTFRSMRLRVHISGRSHAVIPVLVAETLDQHRLGLSEACPDDLGMHAGMLFTFPADTRTPVSMTGMRMSLDVAFLHASGIVGSLVELHPVPDEERPRYRGHLPPHTFRHALELVQGGAARFGIAPGVRIELRSCG